MSLNILYAGDFQTQDAWITGLRAALSDHNIEAVVETTTNTPESIEYVIYAPTNALQDFAPYTNLKAVLSLWAGVDSIIANDSLTAPIARMADRGLQEGMVEYVTGHVLRHHLGMDAHIKPTDRSWNCGDLPPLARKRKVGILGFGALGRACGEALVALNFQVSGWSRSEKSHDTIKTLHGDDGLAEILASCDIFVLLLPSTPATNDLIAAKTLGQMQENAVVINAGRGNVVAEDDLINALNAGQIAHATLDVFKTEPLPPEHPFWDHPAITITPHVASCTRIDTATAFIAQNIKRCEAGKPLLAKADRTLGY